MNQETRTCQGCHETFTIEAEDFAFYEKMTLPAPTWCQECRLQRRLVWRNHRTLYKRKCQAPGHTEDLISAYHPDSPFISYDREYWWSDAWDPLQYGRAYDFEKPFFAQFRALLESVPLTALSAVNSETSSYCNFVHDTKGCYLSFATGESENIFYSERAQQSRDCADIFFGIKNELCYECVNCHDSYRLRFSVDCNSCTDSLFLANCRNCNDCVGCVNLIGASHRIFNEQYSKEDYNKKVVEMELDTVRGIRRAREHFNDLYARSIRRYAAVVGSVGCTGDNIKNSKNSDYCFDIFSGVENCKFMLQSLDVKDSYDGVGQYKHDRCYENVDNDIGESNIGTVTVYNSNDVFYSVNCHASSHLFGCTGLRNKNYCILNKQYTKEEYADMLPKIIAQMNEVPYTDKAGRAYTFGEFFPVETAPFAYNETIAQEYFTFKKPELVERGYPWRDTVDHNYAPTIRAEELPDSAKIPDSIMQEIIGCAHKGECEDLCTMAYRITPQELQFYRKLTLPLPRLCPNCRHFGRLKQRNPLKLWHRKCTCAGTKSDSGVYQNTVEHIHATNHCANEFETPYAPERPKIVYCENCYQSEVG